MPVQFIGMIQPHEVSETIARKGPAVDSAYVRVFAQAHEHAGFDRILVPASSSSPDTLLTVAYAASVTEKIGFLLAHRPGFVAPTLAARQLATLDHYTGGRLAVHYISGGSDEDQQRDGDFLDHDQRYARTDEYLELLRRVWTADKPFDHEGAHYRAKGVWSEVKPLQQPYVPIYFGGASAPALQVAGKHADVYALWGESLAQAGELVRRVRAEATLHGREVEFSISFRPILGKTEEEAWARADQILEDTRRLRVQQGYSRGVGPQQSEGAQRLLADAAKGDRVDERLWTAIAREIGGRSNSTSLVGTPEQVADALLKYYDLGITTFLIRGFDPLVDVIDYGRELLPLVRAKVAERDRQAAGQVALKVA
ncbi:flavin-dependent oxidoreductase, methylene-tetrahydromethanopterin reductase [Acidovorax sp. CF316]|uniref:LLM class flavin-dependent oxidoreductase n=1 Tax=Acidovorax sp. CF316 TaxID=1144317 RepID=UPI00026BEDC3|nr:LLM class flavin-dependent oxidoreductase [Acidovorax sp. CF316]EJE50338.1 flavin-dependent oxidoreductase, methylene-tetrahydromethanopterin reductase [Acidovorax sp. CF316]